MPINSGVILMQHYRCYFLNSSSRIIASLTFDCVDGQAALSEARRHLQDHECRAAAELWCDDCYVGCALRTDAWIEESFGLDAAFASIRLARCPLVQRVF